MSCKIRCLAAALALALLSAGAANARPLQKRSGSSGFLDALWQWLTGRSVPALTAIWEKEGGSMDPDGRMHLSTPPATTNAGSDMDPNGRS